jgi:hypothetical protein
MKRALIALLVLTAAPALAEDLSQAVQTDAVRLKADVEAAKSRAEKLPALKPKALAPDLVTDLQRFGLNATRLSADIDAHGGPIDLRCIFRGMAEETDVQLKAAATATTGAQQADALDRLSHMLRDAAEIAPAARLPAAKTTIAASAKPAATAKCPASKAF